MAKDRGTFMINQHMQSTGKILAGLLIATAAIGSAATYNVDIQGFAFVPASLTIQTGDTVTWTQKDSATHTTTSGASPPAGDGWWDSGLMTLANNTTFSFAFNTPGTYPYFCRLHTYMTATITVQAPLQLAGASVTNGLMQVSWAGGSGPYLLQRKGLVTDPTWLSFGVTTGLTAAAGLDGGAGIYRVADLTQAPKLHFTVWLTGAAERPNAITNTAGSGVGTLDLDGDLLSYTIQYTNLTGTATAAHVHGPAGSGDSAGVLFPLTPVNGFGASGMLTGSHRLTSYEKALLLGGRTYANVHTAANPGGEIRGQVILFPMDVTLSAANERPNPTVSSGWGAGQLSINGNQLSYQIEYTGLSGTATAAHIHGPASPSETAGVKIPLSPAGGFGSFGSLSGTVTLTADQLTILADGQAYANIHTSANPGGEIRGQVSRQLTTIPLKVLLSGDAERPNPVSTAATGMGVLTLDGNTLYYQINYNNLSGMAQAAHIHGPTNSAGSASVLFPLIPVGAFGTSGTLAGSHQLTAEEKTFLLSGQTYANIHTPANPAGEIRGQIGP
jgi:plastocyanin